MSPSCAISVITVAPTATSPSAAMNRAWQRFAGARNNRTLAHHQKSLLDESPSNDRSGAGEDAGKGRPRDAHPFGGRLLVQPLEISQTERLELVDAQSLNLELRGRPTDRLESAPLPPACEPRGSPPTS